MMICGCNPLVDQRCIIFAILAFLLNTIHITYSANVVVIPFSYYTHTLSFIQLTQQLQKQGHNVTFVVSSAVEFRHGELDSLHPPKLHTHIFRSQLTKVDLDECRLAVRGNSYVPPCLDQAYQEADAILSDHHVTNLVRQSG